MLIRQRVKLDYRVRGISSYRDKLVVACPRTKPPSVKLIDQTGRECWSVSTDQQGKQLFGDPYHLCCYDDNGTQTVVVVDENKLILLMTEKGELVTTRRINGDKDPSGVTTFRDAFRLICRNRL